LGGGEQTITLQELVGGGRNVSAFGAQFTAVAWSGEIWGANVQPRVMALRALMVSAQEVQISWRFEKYFCIVRKFQPKYRHAFRCEYDIELVITSDANGAFSQVAPPTVDSQVSAAQADADNQVASIQQVDPSSDAAQAAAAEQAEDAESAGAQVNPNPYAKTPATSANVAATWNSVKAALAIAGPIAQVFASGKASLINLVGAAQLAQQSYLSTLTPNSAQYVAALRLGTTLQIIGANVQQGQNAKTIPVIGGSFIELAGIWYNNPNLAPALQAANGAVSPWLPAGIITNVVLPPFQKAS
jgi:hypothetical protein